MRYEPKDLKVTFREIPDCITLPINIYGCTVHCKECFEKYLWNESSSIGKELDEKAISKLANENPGIDCICFMGGMDVGELNKLSSFIHSEFKGKIKTAWYTGLSEIPKKLDLDFFDYIKVGPYDSQFGGLDKKSTNQVLCKITHRKDGKNAFEDITWKMQENQP